MAGEAKTNRFVLSTATIMIGKQEEVFDLNVEEHSVGLAKNFSITTEPAYTELTQGVTNNIVYSVMTGNPVRCTMEVYEFTARNLKYGLGLDGSEVVSGAKGTVVTGGIVGDDEIVVSGDMSTSAGQAIVVQDGKSDQVQILRPSAAVFATPNTTLTLPLLTAPVVAGDRVWQTNMIEIGSKQSQPFFGAKIVGLLPEDAEPITIIIPKIRIVRGFNLAFSSDNFANLPFEFTPYDLVQSDPFYGQFEGVAKLYARG